MFGSDDSGDDSDLAPRVGSREWHKQRRKKSAEFDKEMDRMDKWFWRLFYAAIAVIVLTFIAGLLIVGFGVVYFDQIIEFLQGFQ